MENIKVINFNSSSYPRLLREISNPPQKLYVLGDETILNNRMISMVGSRNCTDYGRNITYDFSKKLAKEEMIIISGMAMGIDTAAHKGAISDGGKTIAVLGGGFNDIFPKENTELFHEIIKKGGAVITEYAKDVKAQSKHFPERNRIVSGMSIGTVVIEAGHRSGATITARLTKMAGKKVFGVPSNIENRNNIGTHEVINRGAKLVTCVEEILEEYGICKALQEEFQYIPKVKLEPSIPDEYKPIYNILSKNPIHIDEISRTLNLKVSHVSFVLTMLELDGNIKQLPGKMYIRE